MIEPDTPDTSGPPSTPRAHDVSHEWHFRQAQPRDAAAIADFTKRQFTETFGPDNRESDMALYTAGAFHTRAQADEIANEHNCYLVAESDGRIVASALLRVGASNAAVHGGHPMEIQRFYVDARLHGKGIAAQMMNACMAVALEHGVRTVWLGVWEHNPRAIRFYVKHGFVDVGRITFVLGDDVQTDRVMQRSVRSY